MTQLTKTEWINMWTSVKAIEYEAKQIKTVAKQLGPHTGKELTRSATFILNELLGIKAMIQDVLGNKLD